MTTLLNARLYTVCAMALTLVSTPFVHAQKEAASSAAVPIAQPQYASISSTNDTIQISRLPVTLGGAVGFFDVTLTADFGVDAKGNLTFNLVPTVVGSPNLTVNNFKAGTYVGPSNVDGGKNIIVVSGPSPLAGGGTGWTLTIASGASTATYPSSANWYVEPVAGNPFYSRITAAKITASTASAYSFGVGDSGSNPSGDWVSNSLLGFNQVGNTLIISSFTNGYYGTDQPTPQDTITYTLQQ